MNTSSNEKENLLSFADRHLLFTWFLSLSLPLTAVFLVLIWLIRVYRSQVAAVALVPALAITVGLVAAAFQPLQRRVLALRRERFLNDRRPLSDEEFLERVPDAKAAASLVVAARQAMAQMCGVPAESIVPTDPMDVLWSLCDEFGDGDTVLELLAHVSEATGIRIARRGALERLRTFGELCAELPKCVVACGTAGSVAAE